MKQNKYKYLYVLQGFYSGSFSDLCYYDQTSSGLVEAKQDRKAYQTNERGLYRIIKRRELNAQH